MGLDVEVALQKGGAAAQPDCTTAVWAAWSHSIKDSLQTRLCTGEAALQECTHAVWAGLQQASRMMLPSMSQGSGSPDKEGDQAVKQSRAEIDRPPLSVPRCTAAQQRKSSAVDLVGNWSMGIGAGGKQPLEAWRQWEGPGLLIVINVIRQVLGLQSTDGTEAHTAAHKEKVVSRRHLAGSRCRSSGAVLDEAACHPMAQAATH